MASFKSIVVSLPASWNPRSCGVGAHEEARIVGHGTTVEGLATTTITSTTGDVNPSSSSGSSGFRLVTDDPASQAAFVVDLQQGGIHLTPYTIQPVAKCRAPGKRVVIPHDFLTRGSNRTLGLKGERNVSKYNKNDTQKI
jgi:hypothetical protein